MPILTTTIEDPCPLISYSATGWKQGSSGSDDFASSYSQSSFTATNTQDSSVSFSFNGTAVEIFGARRDNHGDYQITIDNVTSTIPGRANPNVFKTSLFSISNLTQGFHTITLTNKPTDNGHKFVDIDFITWKSHIGKDNDNLMVRTVQDTDPSFSFSPSKLWSDNPDQIGLFNGGSGHQITGPTSGSLTYSFAVRDGVQLFGPIGPLGAPYTVQVDGGPVRSLTSVKDFYIPQMMLFHADNLGDGNHVLRLEYHGSSTNQTFAIDYANIINASSMKSSRSRSASASMSRGLSGGLIAAIVILVLLIVACIIAFFLIMRRRWYLPPNDRKLFNEGMIARPPSPPVAPSYYTGYTSSANRMAYGRGNGQRERLTRGNTISSPSILTFTSFDPSVSLGRYSTTGRSYYTRSEGIPEEPIPEPSVPYATVASSSVGGGDSIAASNRARTTQNAKGQTVMGPEAAGAGRELPAPPIEQPLPTESREVDDRQSRFYPSDIAPPDYHQATDPSRDVQDEKGNRSVINR